MSNTTIKVTKKHALKVLELVDQGLVKGLGVQEPGKMCVEAAVCFALGLPHSDNPPCVASSVRAFKIKLNDFNWPSNKDRAEGMRAVAIAQLGSNEIDEKVFVTELTRLIIQKIVPIALRVAAQKHNQNDHKQKLLEVANQCEQTPTEEAASAAKKIAYAAADAYAAAAAYAAYAAYAAANAADAYAAAANAANAADAANAAVAYAAYAAANAADAYAAAAARRLEIYRLAASICVEALKVAKSPGCKWLDLVS